jgi:hypothetical protein
MAHEEALQVEPVWGTERSSRFATAGTPGAGRTEDPTAGEEGTAGSREAAAGDCCRVNSEED